MKNPFLQKANWTALYLIWWVLPSSIHSFVLWKAYNFSTLNIILDTTISFMSFAIIGLSLWYMVKYSINDSENWKTNIQTQILAMLTIFSLWIGSSYGLLSIISSEYSSNFELTILWRILLFLPVYMLIISSYYLFASLGKLNEQKLQTSRMEAMLKASELESLKSQINPHFLFNSLNSVSSLLITDPSKAQEMIINISDFFRHTLMSSKKQFSSLSQEIEHALLYLEIEKGRFGNRIKVHSELPKDLENIEVPSLILQPLVENSVKHGVYESSKEINILLRFTNIGDKVKIEIENEIDDINGSAKKSTGTGLMNVTKRLEVTYGCDNLISTERKENRFKVIIWIPLNEQTNSII